MTPWASQRIARGLLWRAIDEVRREQPEDWAARDREIQRRMKRSERWAMN